MLIVTHCGIFVVGTICAILRQLECIKAIKELTNTAGDTPPFTHWRRIPIWSSQQLFYSPDAFNFSIHLQGLVCESSRYMYTCLDVGVCLCVSLYMCFSILLTAGTLRWLAVNGQKGLYARLFNSLLTQTEPKGVLLSIQSPFSTISASINLYQY